MCLIGLNTHKKVKDLVFHVLTGGKYNFHPEREDVSPRQEIK